MKNLTLKQVLWGYWCLRVSSAKTAAAGGGVARLQGVARVAAGAGAHGLVVLHTAVRGLAAHRASDRRAGVLALVGVACLGLATLAGAGALSGLAGQQRVADVGLGAGAHRAGFSVTVGAWGAGGAGAAGVGVAQVGFSEGSAGLEGMSGVVLGAGADGLVVLDFADGVGAAGAHTGVYALELEASLVGPAVVVLGALSVAFAVGISQEELGALAADAVLPDVAVGTLAAGVVGAGVGAAVLAAGLVSGAVGVAEALGAAALEWVADVVVDAGAHGPGHGCVGLHTAVGVFTAGAGVTEFTRVEGPAGLEGVASHATAAGAHGLVVANLALGAGAADVGDAAGVDTLLALAGLIPATVARLQALSAGASGEGVAFEAEGAAADRPVLLSLAVSAVPAGVGEAGVVGDGGGVGTDLRNEAGASGLCLAHEALRARAEGAVVPGGTVSAVAAGTGAAHALTLLLPALVVVRALEVADALRLAAVDGVAVRNVASDAAAAGDAGAADLAARVGAAGVVSTGVAGPRHRHRASDGRGTVGRLGVHSR